MPSIQEIIVVFKTHLDIGYTDYAARVKERYLSGYIPAALKLARETRATDSRFIWTTGSWLIDEYLREADAPGRAAMEEAVRMGDIGWHALPFTTHTELMDAPLFRCGLSVSQTLDARFGRKTMAAKLTDVPGHTVAMVPLLAEAGVSFLHLGINPVSTVPKLPDFFIWRAEDGSEIKVMVNFGYGEFSPIGDTGAALMFAHTGDNNGPQSAEEIARMYQRLREQYPDALIKAGTLNDVAEAAQKAQGLPVITCEIGDSWIHGAGTDPRKVSQYRAMLRLRKSFPEPYAQAANRHLINIPEHTWGFDFKHHLHDRGNYKRADFEAVRGTEPYKRIERSWEEQREFVWETLRVLPGDLAAEAENAQAEYRCDKPAYEKLSKADSLSAEFKRAGWTFSFREDGALNRLIHDGRAYADKEHPLAVFLYEAFSRRETDRYVSQYMDCSKFPRLEPLAVDDFNKLGMEAAIDRYRSCGTKLTGLYGDGESVIARLLPTDGELHALYGCPAEMMLRVTPRADRFEMDFAWWDKPASRVAEGLWLGMAPTGRNGRVSKLGRLVDVTDVVSHGGRKLHATDRGVFFGGFSVETLDTALVNIGTPSLWNFDDRPADFGAGLWFNLYNNQWNTNFPLWYGEDARFRFYISIQ